MAAFTLLSDSANISVLSLLVSIDYLSLVPLEVFLVLAVKS